MKAIIEYSDFRKYMRDFYEERKLRHVFSWREFSKAAGFTSSSYMKVVCDGKSNLSRIGVERTGQAMGLVGFEMDYFRAMVNFGQETDETKKKAAYEEMLSIAKIHKVRVIEGELFKFYETWKNPVLRELAPLMPGATPGEIAKKCYMDISANDVKETLDFLTKAGFIKKTGENTFVQTETSIKGSPEATKLAIRDMHREMAKIAASSLDLAKTERNFSGVTMGISKDSYEQIVKELDECRRKIISIAAGDKNIDQVYRLNLQLFPLTRKVKENGDD
ncbi:MAG: TIGR02147 family protein [Fibrobacter sp.]|uniref:TIGR02147 family protein n=1 Tax=Fibrobacter sp. TaxID=35828 RepID=UPI0025C385E8|nr:TIGR02147 family protein [Fibrobacter sp.]MBQ7081449.1 TIGR02147 family protein [Fibrobacter sp.]